MSSPCLQGALRTKRKLRPSVLRIGIRQNIERLLSSRDVDAFKTTKKAFTQDPDITPVLLVCMVVSMVATRGAVGYTTYLALFWSRVVLLKIPNVRQRMVSAAAFCVARQKLKADLWFALALDVVEEVKAKRKRNDLWHGYRPVAVDGTRLTFPRAKALLKEYGTAAGGKWPQATMTTLCDIRNRMPVNMTLGRAASSERVGLAEIIGSLSSTDILIGDRGFPSTEVIRSLIDRGIHFVMRLSVGTSFAQVNEFAKSGCRDCVIDLVRKRPRKGDRPMRVRLVRCEVQNEEPHILVTTVHRVICKAREIGQLYRERWQIEELFKLWKSLAPTSRQFHSKTVAGIQQEVGARFLHLAICAAYFATTMNEKRWSAKGLNVNQKAGIAGIDEFLVAIILAPTWVRTRQLEDDLLKILGCLPYKRRPGRSAPRASISPNPRWASRGRTSRKKVRKRAPISPVLGGGVARKRLQVSAKTR